MRLGSDSLTSRHRLALALSWLALLLVAGWFVGQHLQLSGDLRKFMPSATKPGISYPSARLTISFNEVERSTEVNSVKVRVRACC